MKRITLSIPDELFSKAQIELAEMIQNDELNEASALEELAALTVKEVEFQA